MKINLKNPAHIKLLLLSNGVNFEDRDFEGVGRDFSENRYYYNVSNDPAQFKNKLPSEILLPKDIESSVYYNPESKVKLKHQDGKFGLFTGDSLICPVALNLRPKFFDKKIGDEGLDCKKVISMYGRYVLAIFSNSFCLFFHEGVPCKFCSLGPSRKRYGGENLNVITPVIIREAIEVAKKTDGKRIKYVMYTCGTHLDSDRGYREQAEIIKNVCPYLPKKVGHHLTIMPTLNVSSFETLKSAGLNSIAFDIEVYDKKIFQDLCPGKEKFFGHDNFIESFKIGRKIFGHSNIKAGFVGGLGPLESMTEGMEFFGRQGISIAINVFHPDLNTPLSNKPRPSEAYLFKMVEAQTKIYEKYKLIPVFPVGGRRSSMDTEVYRGFFK